MKAATATPQYTHVIVSNTGFSYGGGPPLASGQLVRARGLPGDQKLFGEGSRLTVPCPPEIVPVPCPAGCGRDFADQHRADYHARGCDGHVPPPPDMSPLKVRAAEAEAALAEIENRLEDLTALLAQRQAELVSVREHLAAAPVGAPLDDLIALSARKQALEANVAACRRELARAQRDLAAARDRAHVAVNRFSNAWRNQ